MLKALACPFTGFQRHALLKALACPFASFQRHALLKALACPFVDFQVAEMMGVKLHVELNHLIWDCILAILSQHEV